MMKKIGLILLVCLIVFPVLNSCQKKKVLHVLLITGGHGYDEAAFNEMLEKLPVTYDHVKHPDAHAFLKILSQALLWVS